MQETEAYESTEKPPAECSQSTFLALSVVAVAGAVVIGMPGMARAEFTIASSTNWTGTVGNWNDSTWDNSAPGSNSNAYIQNGTVNVTAPGATCAIFDVGVASSGTATGAANLVINGGQLTTSDGFAYAANGTANLVGYHSGSSGTLTINSGTLSSGDGSQIVVGGWGGTGVVNQTGGLVQSLDSDRRRPLRGRGILYRGLWHRRL